jgi:hypothetical protein
LTDALSLVHHLTMTSPVTKSPKVLGYILNPLEIFEKAINDGTAVHNQIYATFVSYQQRITQHCGLALHDITPLATDGREPHFCLTVAASFGGDITAPRLDVIERAKEFLGTTQEPQWYAVEYLLCELAFLH